jgi:hypothetical protein
MSITGARSYLRSRAKAIGLKEWTDGFNFQNIPSNIINGMFHITTGSGSGVKLNQNDQEIVFNQTVRIFVKGFRDPASAIDSAIKMTEDLIKESVSPKNRLTQSDGIKNIVLDGFSFEQMDQSNDNLVVASITFRINTVLGL